MTYEEILTAFANQGLKDKVKVALLIAADKIRVESPATTVKYEERQRWAKLAFSEPDSQVPPVLWSVLAQNRALTLAQVTGANDAAVQTAVEAAVASFAI